MSRPNVYIVNQPLLRGGGAAVDVRPAAAFGELRYVFPPGHPTLDPSHVRSHIEEKLAGFTSRDYLVPIGHTLLIVAASAYAARRSGGRLNVLVWDNRDHIYVPVTLDLAPRGDGIAARELENRYE